MRLLCLSNGHGEDVIALEILRALQVIPQSPQIEVLPIVGEGHAYTKAGFSIMGEVKAMPSGGFIYMDRQQFANDLKSGLLGLTLSQLKSIRHWAAERKRQQEAALILAVGDIVPLAFAWQSGLPFAFVGTAKSEYYLRDESGPLVRSRWSDDRLAYLTGSDYLPWERWFMSRKRCRAVFPRDRLTAETLQQFNIPAYDLGNPMMDLDATANSTTEVPTDPTQPLTLLLLPGSRAPEAYRNWQIILSALQDLANKFDRPIHGLAALTPSLDRATLDIALHQAGWNLTDENWVCQTSRQPMKLNLVVGDFANAAYRSDIAIAMAGTATEQFVGLGKPAITIAGSGPQFTAEFAEAQTRLLGSSILKIDSPTQTTRTLQHWLNHPHDQRQIAENGKRRMGQSGAATRIAHQIIQLF